jgi:hypothetical protein
LFSAKPLKTLSFKKEYSGHEVDEIVNAYRGEGKNKKQAVYGSNGGGQWQLSNEQERISGRGYSVVSINGGTSQELKDIQEIAKVIIDKIISEER